METTLIGLYVVCSHVLPVCTGLPYTVHQGKIPVGPGDWSSSTCSMDLLVQLIGQTALNLFGDWGYKHLHDTSTWCGYRFSKRPGLSMGWSSSYQWSIPYRSIPLSTMKQVCPRQSPDGSYQRKNLKGQYMDVFNWKRKIKRTLIRRIRKNFKWKNVDRTWANWLPGILIYIGSLAWHHPIRTAPLFQSINIIYEVYRDFTGSTWLQYDD